MIIDRGMGIMISFFFCCEKRVLYAATGML
jgi:hypothetical protein